MTAELRAARARDVAELVEVFHRSRRTSMPWLPVLHTPEEDLAFFGATVERGEVTVAAGISDEVRGFIAIADGWVHHLYVDPASQGKGIGTALLALAQQQPRLQLWAFADNHVARSFYRRRGFVDVEHTDGSGNEERLPDVRMEWPGTGG